MFHVALFCPRIHNLLSACSSHHNIHDVIFPQHGMFCIPVMQVPNSCNFGSFPVSSDLWAMHLAIISLLICHRRVDACLVHHATRVKTQHLRLGLPCFVHSHSSMNMRHIVSGSFDMTASMLIHIPENHIPITRHVSRKCPVLCEQLYPSD